MVRLGELEERVRENVRENLDEIQESQHPEDWFWEETNLILSGLSEEEILEVAVHDPELARSSEAEQTPLEAIGLNIARRMERAGREEFLNQGGEF